MKLFLLSVLIIPLVSHAQTLPKQGAITAENAKQYGFSFNTRVPAESEPDFIVITIEFPKILNEGFEYRYSSALFAKDGKRYLSYRPQDTAIPSSESAQIVIAINKEILSCVSLVNVYHELGSNSIHPSSRGASIDFTSFVSHTAECPEGDHAGNYY